MPPQISIDDVNNVSKIYNGSGGNYLSNEIFYRVSAVRSGFNSDFPSGHIHIPHFDYQESVVFFNAIKKMIPYVV